MELSCSPDYLADAKVIKFSFLRAFCLNNCWLLDAGAHYLHHALCPQLLQKPQQAAQQILASGGFGFSRRRRTRLQRFFIFLVWDWDDLPSCRRTNYFSFDEISRAFSQCAVLLFLHRYFGHERQYYCWIELN